MDESVIPQTAEDIMDDLSESGHDVLDCKPWARPTLDVSAEPITPPPASLF